MKNFIVQLLISLGTPMLLMGDEMRRTQRGNNNAYCQDNELSWLDWRLLDSHRDLHRFVQMMIAHRLRGIEMGVKQTFGLSLNELLRRGDIEWHGGRLGCPDWSDDSHSIACTARGGPGQVPLQLHLMANAYWEALDFELPAVPETAISGWQDGAHHHVNVGHLGSSELAAAGYVHQTLVRVRVKLSNLIDSRPRRVRVEIDLD